LDDAIAFYERTHASHIVQAPSWKGRIYYVNEPVEYSCDPDTGTTTYELARTYPSYVIGSLETAVEEFDYLPGFRVIRRRE
jgi:hypothetical protein